MRDWELLGPTETAALEVPLPLVLQELVDIKLGVWLDELVGVAEAVLDTLLVRDRDEDAF